MEIDVLILHGIPWRIFHGNPWNSMEFHGGFSHGVHRMMAYTGKALQPSVSYTHFNFPFIILISRFHFKIANVGYRVAGSECLRIDKLFSPLELVAKNTMLDVVLNELKSVL